MGDWTYKSKWLVTHQPLEVLLSTLAQRCTADVHNTNAPRLLPRPKRRQLAPSPKNKSVVPRMVAPERSLPSDNQNTTQLFPSEDAPPLHALLLQPSSTSLVFLFQNMSTMLTSRELPLQRRLKMESLNKTKPNTPPLNKERPIKRLWMPVFCPPSPLTNS